MTADAARAGVEYGPWNPGIESQVPRRLRHLVTVFRPENAFADYAKAQELADFTGLAVTELVAFRPQRLALHELLVRVTADFSVPDGSRIEDLGINFREIVRAILARDIAPRLHVLAATYEAARRRLAAKIDAELVALLPGSAAAAGKTPQPPASRWRKLFAAHRGSTAVAEPAGNDEQRLIAQWERKARASGDELDLVDLKRRAGARQDGGDGLHDGPRSVGAVACARRRSSIGMWHRIRCPGSGSESGGSSVSQISPSLRGHLVWKTHPRGGETALGISPCSWIRARALPSMVGTADRRDSV